MDRLKNMKKKLFIGGAYLVVALLLLIYVSYSAYRIKIAPEVWMPEALAQDASLDLEYSQDSGTDSLGKILNNLKPNENVNTYKNQGYEAAKEAGRAIKCTVSNATYISKTTGETSDEYSKLAIRYTLKLSETGVVPLEVILVDDTTGDTYKAVTDDNYNERTVKFTKTDGSGKEAEFSFGNHDVETRCFTLYFGWNNSKGVYSGSERKEIASVDIRAEITQDRPEMRDSDVQVATPVNGYYTRVRPSGGN